MYLCLLLHCVGVLEWMHMSVCTCSWASKHVCMCTLAAAVYFACTLYPCKQLQNSTTLPVLSTLDPDLFALLKDQAPAFTHCSR